MGSSSSKNHVYPLPQPAYYGQYHHQPDPVSSPHRTKWYLTGRSKKGKERADGYAPWPGFAPPLYQDAYYPPYGAQIQGYGYPGMPVIPAGIYPPQQQQQQMVAPAAAPPPPQISQQAQYASQQQQMPAPQPAIPTPVIPPEPATAIPSGIPPPPVIPPQANPPQATPVVPPQSQFGQQEESMFPPGFVPTPPEAPQPMPPRTNTFEPRTLRNPLPAPPRDIWDEHSPYRALLRDLPTTTALLTRPPPRQSQSPLLPPPPNHNEPPRRRPSLFSSLRGKKRSGGGLFRSHSAQSSGSNTSNSNANGGLVFNIPPQQPNSVSPAPPSGQQPPSPGRPPAVRFDHQGPLAPFLNHSPHRVLYQNRTYPSALHLLEALKFLPHRSDLAERIRACRDAVEVYPLSASLHADVRGDWGDIFLQKVEEVLYLKFKQHPALRALLMETGIADLVYAEANDAFYGEGPVGTGANELGKALVRVRERLRAEGYGP